MGPDTSRKTGPSDRRSEGFVVAGRIEFVELWCAVLADCRQAARLSRNGIGGSRWWADPVPNKQSGIGHPSDVEGWCQITYYNNIDKI